MYLFHFFVFSQIQSDQEVDRRSFCRESDQREQSDRHPQRAGSPEDLQLRACDACLRLLQLGRQSLGPSASHHDDD